MTSSAKPPTRKSIDPPTDELEALFRQKGAAAIATLRTYDPAAYIRAIAALIRDDDDA